MFFLTYVISPGSVYSTFKLVLWNNCKRYYWFRRFKRRYAHNGKNAKQKRGRAYTYYLINSVPDVTRSQTNVETTTL